MGAQLHTILADRDGKLRTVLHALRALQAGDDSVRLPADWTGMAGEIATLFNDMAGQRPAGRTALRLRRRRRAGAIGHAARLDADQGVAILNALLSAQTGDASLRLPAGWPGLAGKIAGAFNDMVELNARASTSKSALLANARPRARTPLNSLLILSDQLSQNREGNLTERQVDFAKTIHSSGTDLLDLIDDILDLSKLESGTVVADVSELNLDDLHRYLERTFRPIAEARSLDFQLRTDPRAPASIATDAKRLQQILKNLLFNAFKFTHHGQVALTMEPAEAGWSVHNERLNRAAGVVAFQVTDTGIGIPSDKQQIVFEAFHQADDSIGRKYAGTGLGLAISRELSTLLGGEIGLVSSPGRGSSFTLYLPTDYTSPRLTRGAAQAGVGAAARATTAELSKPVDPQPLRLQVPA
jgi:signal transduction histidine kinase